MDEDGYVRIVGRIKDMICRGGENIYPTEIERLLFTNPKVEDAQVFGVPDARLGEAVCAWIRLHRGATCTVEEMKEFCKGKVRDQYGLMEEGLMSVHAYISECTFQVQLYALLAVYGTICQK